MIEVLTNNVEILAISAVISLPLAWAMYTLLRKTAENRPPQPATLKNQVAAIAAIVFLFSTLHLAVTAYVLYDQLPSFNTRAEISETRLTDVAQSIKDESSSPDDASVIEKEIKNLRGTNVALNKFAAMFIYGLVVCITSGIFWAACKVKNEA